MKCNDKICIGNNFEVAIVATFCMEGHKMPERFNKDELGYSKLIIAITLTLMIIINVIIRYTSLIRIQIINQITSLIWENSITLLVIAVVLYFLFYVERKASNEKPIDHKNKKEDQ